MAQLGGVLILFISFLLIRSYGSGSTGRSVNIIHFFSPNKVIWEWLNWEKEWYPYPRSLNSQIEELFQSEGSKWLEVVVSLPSPTPILLDLHHQRQVNLSTGVRWPIRRLETPKANGGLVCVCVCVYARACVCVCVCVYECVCMCLSLSLCVCLSVLGMLCGSLNGTSFRLSTPAKSLPD